MRNFIYKATARDGSIANGIVSALDRAAAFVELDKLKLQPLSLSENAAESRRQDRALTSGETIRLRQAEVLDFTEELSELLRGGIPLERALGIIERRESKSKLPVVAKEIRSRVRDGKTLSESLKGSSPDFGELYCRLVAAGEESGALCAILARHAVHMKALQGLKSRVAFAMIYPAFLCVSAIGVSTLFIVFLIPKLMELLDSTGGSLPLGAQFMVDTGAFFQATWYVWIAVLLAGTVFCFWYAKTHPTGWDRFLMKLPLMGKVLHLRQQVQFLETLASLTGNGLPIVNGLTLTRNALSSPVYREELDLIRTRVQDGEGLSNSLVHSSCFPPLMSDLIAVGEETGDLSGALERASLRFDAELTGSVEKISAFIQPAVILVMAGMVGCMAYLMISAIFQTVSGLSG